MTNPVVFALVKNYLQAETAVAALELAGFSTPVISVLASNADPRGFIDPDVFLASERESAEFGRGVTREVGHVNSNKTSEDAVTGGTSGATLRGTSGRLISIGALAAPGLASLVAAGPILAALSGLSIGVTTGGLIGAMVGCGIPEYEVNLYAGKIVKGHILISVHALNKAQAEIAQKALEGVDAHDVRITSEIQSDNFA